MVYVDDSRIKYGRMYMCHMWADTLDELLQMADMIGLNRRYLQSPPKSTWTHFDICLKNKTKAIKNGAILVTTLEALEHRARENNNIKLLEAIEKRRKRQNG